MEATDCSHVIAAQKDSLNREHEQSFGWGLPIKRSILQPQQHLKLNLSLSYSCGEAASICQLSPFCCWHRQSIYLYKVIPENIPEISAWTLLLTDSINGCSHPGPLVVPLPHNIEHKFTMLSHRGLQGKDHIRMLSSDWLIVVGGSGSSINARYFRAGVEVASTKVLPIKIFPATPTQTTN